MAEENSLRRIVEDLIDVMHFQAKEPEALADQIEQVAGRLPEPDKLSLVRSQLSELKRRVSGPDESPLVWIQAFEAEDQAPHRSPADRVRRPVSAGTRWMSAMRSSARAGSSRVEVSGPSAPRR